MHPPALIGLLPAASLRGELDAILAERPRLRDLLRRHPDEPTSVTPSLLTDASRVAAYPVVRVPVRGAVGELLVGRLPGMRRPEHVEAELAAVRDAGVCTLVGLAPLATVRDDYGVAGYEGAARALFGDGFLYVPTVDYEVCAFDELWDGAVALALAALRRGEPVLAHCVAGCGRTGAFAACLMVLAGAEVDDAVRTYRKHRGCGPETIEQVAYVARYAMRLRA